MNYNRIELLDIIEEYAASNGMIDSEESLSSRFDEDIAMFVVEQYGEDDGVAMNEAFNNWSDMLCKDGELHEEQYKNYTYVGKYSEEV